MDEQRLQEYIDMRETVVKSAHSPRRDHRQSNRVIKMEASMKSSADRIVSDQNSSYMRPNTQGD